MSEKFYDEFYRQRRNLILISVVLFFVISSELTWNKYSVWGNEIILKNPDGVLTFLWVIWAYWIWRFWVYALEYKGGFISSIREEIKREIRKIYESSENIQGDVGKIIIEDQSLKISLGEILYEFVYYRENESQNSIRSNYNDFEEVLGWDSYKLIFSIFIRIILSHKSFTDQILPFLIAIVPIVFLVSTKGIF